MLNVKNFILVYVALRSFIAIFYGVNIVAGLNILEIGGFVFPVVLLLYWAMANFRTATNNCKRIYFLVVAWVLLTTILKIFSYGFHGIQSFSFFIRIINGFAVFIVFPLIFKDHKSINALINAFFIATFFPLLQGLAQLLLGADIGGMRTSVSDTYANGGLEMYYGLYYKYEGYSWAALLGGLIMIYKMGLASKIKTKRMYIFGLFFVLYLILALLTLSRVLLVSMSIVFIAIVFAITKEKSWPKKVMTILILILLALVLSMFEFTKDRREQVMMRSKDEFQVISGEIEVDAAFHGRAGLWKYKIEQFRQTPLIDKIIGTNIGTGPHGDYVEWLLKCGYIGISLYSILFFCLLVSSIRTFSRINKTQDYYMRPYGLMVIAGLIIWLLEAIIHNSSQMPDYSYFIIGSTAIFLSYVDRSSAENFQYELKWNRLSY